MGIHRRYVRRPYDFCINLVTSNYTMSYHEVNRIARISTTSMGFNKKDIARKVFLARTQAIPFPLFSQTYPNSNLVDSYSIGEAVEEEFVQVYGPVVGWKAGYTNKSLWNAMGVVEPFYAPMYNKTVHEIVMGTDTVYCNLDGMVSPRIEPEIVFRLRGDKKITPDMSDSHVLMECVDGIAFGYEIVSSVPGWKNITPRDAIIIGGLHSALFHTPFIRPSENMANLISKFTAVLAKNGQQVAKGTAWNVVESPLISLKDLARIIDRTRGDSSRRLKSGDLVTTGSITAACPVNPGEKWRTELHGIGLVPFEIQFGQGSKL